MTPQAAIAFCAALILVAAFVARHFKPLQGMALCANVFFFWQSLAIGSWVLLGINILLTVLNLRALLGKIRGRRATRPLAEMDADVQTRIREISAESRYSSAGIEF